MRKSKIYLISEIDFKTIIKTSKSYSECLSKIGLTTRGGSSSKILKERINELNLSIDHFETTKTPEGIYKKIPLSEICVQNSTYKSTSKLKITLVKAKILEYKCSICELSEWLGKPISLQLDHINGINNDNRIENLRLLCPNCHSQTDTYAGKKLKKEKVKKPRPTKITWPKVEELEILLKTKSVLQISKDLRVSDNAVRKFCLKNNIKMQPRHASITSTA